VGKITVDIRKGDITRVKAAAIVNAANSLGRMAGGVALAIKRAGGAEIEKEAMALAPIPLGAAVATPAGRLPYRYVIHAPTMRRPRQRIPPENVAIATRAALQTADELGCESLAIPGLGTRTGKVNHTVAARQMFEAIAAHKPRALRHVVFVDIDKRMVEAWKKVRRGEEEPRHGRGERLMPRTRAPQRRRHRHRLFRRPR